jgi:hypothetical protein
MTDIKLICLLIALTVCGAAAAQPIALPDQNGELIGLADYQAQHPDQAVLAIVVSGRKLRLVKGWEEGLRESYPQLVSMRVADIKDEPRPSQDQVAEKLRKRAPENVSILIDLENRWATDYGLDTEEPCLLLFDSQGKLVAQFRGRASKARLGEVSAALAKWLPATAEDSADAQSAPKETSS